jgi:hypothetical protein
VTPEVLKLRLAIITMATRYGAAERNYAYAVADGSPTLRAHRATHRRHTALLRLVDALAKQLAGPAAIDAVRGLCKSYTPDPPPLFALPDSEHGKGFNEGTRHMSDAVLATIDDAMGGQR